jgi:apolipoprotein N-acyltransferase
LNAEPARLRAPAAAALAATGGLLHTASFAPLDAWPLQILGLLLLVLALDSADARRAARLGWMFGFCWLASGFWWLFISIHRYGDVAAPLAAAAVALLAAALALYYALAAALWARLRADGSKAAFNAALFAACWLLAELGRGVLLHRFPGSPAAALHRWAPRRLGAVDRRVRHRCAGRLDCRGGGSGLAGTPQPARAAALARAAAGRGGTRAGPAQPVHPQHRPAQRDAVAVQRGTGPEIRAGADRARAALAP